MQLICGKLNEVMHVSTINNLMLCKNNVWLIVCEEKNLPVEYSWHVHLY